MKRVTGFLIAASLLSLAFATVAFAQQQTPEGVIVKQPKLIQGLDGGPPPPDANFVFVASESFGGKVVKGAPYSADTVTETIQTLGDGNRIVNRITSAVYRDSEGRTRREQTLGLGIFGTGEEPLQTIFINDPVAGVTYALDSKSHIAHKSVPFKFELGGKPGAGWETQTQRFEVKVAPGETATGTARSMIVTAPPPAGAPLPPPDADHFTMRTEAGAAITYAIRTKTGPNPNEVKEQLGKQMIEGIEAEGTRTTVTIPAGEIGNERPIEIVSERWYSPELQLVVMTRHSDPRTGETIYKLANINRAEPAKSLFEVPAGYTVKDGPQFGPAIGPLMQRAKKPNPEE